MTQQVKFEKAVDILLVDDTPANLCALEAILQGQGYNLVFAHSGDEAIKALRQRNFAVILLDVMMPVMDGFELASMIKEREEFCTIPIIFLTASAPNISKIYRAYSVGGVDYLHKPLDPEVVRAKVAVFAELHRRNLQIKHQAELIHQNQRRESLRQYDELKRHGELRYRKLADAIPHIVWIASATGQVEYFNERWFEYTNLSPKSSRNWWECLDAFHQEDLERFLEVWQGVVKEGKAFEIECRLKRAADGSYRWHMCRAQPEVDQDGRTIAWLGTFTDIDERRQAAEELQHLRRAADAANKAKSDFLAHMSHEIRTPLGAISGFTELLMDPEATSEDKKKWTATISRNCSHLSRLIDDVLDLSKIEAGQLEIDSTTFPLSDVLSEVQSTLNQLALAKGLYYKAKYSGPPVTTITTDQVRLKQILINIIGNAIKFTEKGGVSIEINQVQDELTGNSTLRFVVSDTGPGIEKEQINRLFQPFMQADKSTSRRFGGSGLGLALSRKIAIALGGDLVLAESTKDIGSTFIITIASGRQQDRTAIAVNGATAQTIPLTRLRQLENVRILLVEDLPDNQILVMRFLELEGAIVDLAKNGHEGVEKSLATEYDIVLMDVQMPLLDGYEAARILRGKNYPQPIIALTAHVMKGERERCLAAGYTDYLSKPINRSKLIERIKFHLHQLPIGRANLGRTHSTL